ncbi:MAG: (Fe-S)-binding protein [Bryobacteraceae bacterium]|nr:(Fe-S)-binding protein [Bryobacteraceae bacterium]
MRVSLFVTCLVDQLFPRVGLAMAEVLERAGCELEFREAQTCCGQPAFNSGFLAEAREVASHFVEVFADAEYIVAPSGSCAAMVGHHYARLLPGDSRAAAIAARTYEFSTFLLDVLGAEDCGARFPATVTYHDSCHALRELRIQDGPRRLLGKVRELKLTEMDTPAECCGFGGTFSVKFPEISGSMVRSKVDSILASGADAVVSTDVSCLMHIEGAMRRGGHPMRAVHLAEVLASR